MDVLFLHELLQATGKRLLSPLCDGIWPSFSAEQRRTECLPYKSEGAHGWCPTDWTQI